MGKSTISMAFPQISATSVPTRPNKSTLEDDPDDQVLNINIPRTSMFTRPGLMVVNGGLMVFDGDLPSGKRLHI